MYLHNFNFCKIAMENSGAIQEEIEDLKKKLQLTGTTVFKSKKVLVFKTAANRGPTRRRSTSNKRAP